MRKNIIILFIILFLLSGCSQENENITNEIIVEEIINSEKEPITIEESLIKFNEIFNIPATYNSIDTEEKTRPLLDTYGIVLYNEYEGNIVEINTDIYGNLISYKNLISQEDFETNYSLDHAIEKSQQLLLKLYGNHGYNFKLIKAEDSPNKDNSYLISYTRRVNGLLVPSDGLDIYINRGSLNIDSVNVFTKTNYDFTDISYFDDLEDVKIGDLPLEKFKEANPLYYGYFDKNFDLTKESSYMPVYQFICPQIPINGKSLEKEYITFYKEEIPSSEIEENHSKEKDVNGNLDKELNEVNKRARELFNLDKNYQLDNFSYNEIEKKSYDIWELNYSDEDKTNITITMNSDNLSLLGYIKDNDKEVIENNSIEFDKIEDISNQFITNNTNIKYEELELIDNYKYFQNDPYNYNFTYLRKIGDAYILSDYVNIIIDRKSQEVIYFYRNWDGNINKEDFNGDSEKFKDNIDEMYSIILDNYDFKLVYIRDKYDESNKPVKAYYVLLNSNATMDDIYLDMAGNKVDF